MCENIIFLLSNLTCRLGKGRPKLKCIKTGFGQNEWTVTNKSDGMNKYFSICSKLCRRTDGRSKY